MATLELGSLEEHLDNDQIRKVRTALSEAGAPPLSEDEHAESVLVERDLDDDVVTDFFDRLEANDALADIYVPVDFEDVVEVDGIRVGSSHALITVLESLKDDFLVEDEDEVEVEEAEDDEDFEADAFDDDDDGADLFGSEEDAIDLKDDRLKQVWHALNKGARASVKRNVNLFIRT